MSGYLFFNFGGGCVVRLLVALDSLVQHTTKPITVMLDSDDYNKEAAPYVERYAKIQWEDLRNINGQVGRNRKSALKPELFRRSPFEHTILFDGDLLFLGSPDPLLGLLELDAYPYIVTQFSTWKTNGSRMRKRVRRTWDHLSARDKGILSGPHPAVNIGVMGWRKGHDQILDDWEKMTLNLAGQHIADEIACQVTYHRHPHAVVGPAWNDSCVFNGVPEKGAKILHYHGNKHTSLTRPSSVKWLQHLDQMLSNSLIPEKFLKWPDKALKGMIKDNKNWREKIHAATKQA